MLNKIKKSEQAQAGDPNSSIPISQTLFDDFKYETKQSIYSSLFQSIYNKQYSSLFMAINIFFMVLTMFVTLLVLYLGMKHLSGVNDGVVEFITDHNIYRLHPAKKLKNYDYYVNPQPNAPNNFIISQNNSEQIETYVLNQIKEERDVLKYMTMSYTVQRLEFGQFILFYSAITLSIYLVSIKIFELLDESMEFMYISAHYEMGYAIFGIGLWCFVLALSIYWTSVQFISSNLDIVNCIVRTVGMVFISQFDEFAYQAMSRVPFLHDDIHQFENLKQIEYTVIYDLKYYILNSLYSFAMFYYLITPMYFFMRRILKFYFKHDYLPDTYVARI